MKRAEPPMPNVLVRSSTLNRAEPSLHDGRYLPTLVASLVLACLLSRSALAQQFEQSKDDSIFRHMTHSWTRTQTADSTDCYSRIPIEQMPVGKIVLSSGISDSNAIGIDAERELMARDVAGELRELLGGNANDIPAGFPRVRPKGIPARLTVIAFRDGRVARYAESEYGDTTAASILQQAFDQARDNGSATMLWPDDLTDDSIVTRLTLDLSTTTTIPKGKVEWTFAAFTMPQPTEFPALLKKGGSEPPYPYELERMHVGGGLMMEFVVDTIGRAVAAGMHDLWPANKPRLTGTHLQFYGDFVETVRSWLVESARFSPARRGSCPVNQIVQLPIQFVTAKRR